MIWLESKGPRNNRVWTSDDYQISQEDHDAFAVWFRGAFLFEVESLDDARGQVSNHKDFSNNEKDKRANKALWAIVDREYDSRALKVDWNGMEGTMRSIFNSTEATDTEKLELLREALAAYTKRG